MFSLIRKTLVKARSLKTLYRRVDDLEARLAVLENISEEYNALKCFVEDAARHEEEAYQTLQRELDDAYLRKIKPWGEA
jgi:phage/plasmid-associated DNA primase